MRWPVATRRPLLAGVPRPALPLCSTRHLPTSSAAPPHAALDAGQSKHQTSAPCGAGCLTHCTLTFVRARLTLAAPLLSSRSLLPCVWVPLTILALVFADELYQLCVSCLSISSWVFYSYNVTVRFDGVTTSYQLTDLQALSVHRFHTHEVFLIVAIAADVLLRAAVTRQWLRVRAGCCVRAVCGLLCVGCCAD